jgi:hypothetical protein
MHVAPEIGGVCPWHIALREMEQGETGIAIHQNGRLEFWRTTTAGIEHGQEWYRAIMQKLDDATDVVVLLTTNSVNRPWILYEAGVAKGKLTANGRVLGIALGVSLDEAATGPFAQFQNSPDEEDAITGLVLPAAGKHRNLREDRHELREFHEASDS